MATLRVLAYMSPPPGGIFLVIPPLRCLWQLVYRRRLRKFERIGVAKLLVYFKLETELADMFGKIEGSF